MKGFLVMGDNRLKEVRAFKSNREISNVLERMQSQSSLFEECVIDYVASMVYFLEEACGDEEAKERKQLHDLSLEFYHKLEKRFLEQGKYKTEARDKKIAAVIDRLVQFGAPREKAIQVTTAILKFQMDMSTVKRINRKYCSSKGRADAKPKPFTYISAQDFFEIVDIGNTVDTNCEETILACNKLIREMQALSNLEQNLEEE